jgi:hypothetical protein
MLVAFHFAQKPFGIRLDLPMDGILAIKVLAAKRP